MPDFFDRLLARSMPMGADFESVAGAVRVRPRVPGRYERAQPAFAVTEVDVEAQTSLAPGLARPVAAVVPAPAAAARPAAAPVGRPRAARMAAEPAAEQSGEPAPVETPRPGPAPHVTGVRPVERVVRERAVPAASAGLPDAAPAAVAPPAPPAVERAGRD